MAGGNGDANQALLAALAHPLRRRILRAMPDGEEAISPSRLAADLKEPLTHLSYHVRVLAACGAIALERTESSKGSTQHFYRSTLTADWAKAALREGDGGTPGAAS